MHLSSLTSRGVTSVDDGGCRMIPEGSGAKWCVRGIDTWAFPCSSRVKTASPVSNVSLVGSFRTGKPEKERVIYPLLYLELLYVRFVIILF